MVSKTERGSKEDLLIDNLCSAIREMVSPTLGAAQVSCQRKERTQHHANLLSWYSLKYRDKEGSHDDELVAKTFLHWPQRARLTYQRLQQLWDAGFRPPAPFRITRAYGYSAELSTLVVENAPGEPWRNMILRGGQDLKTSSELAADWLLHLHESKVRFPRANRQITIARVERFVRELGNLFPADAARIQEIGRVIVRGMRQSAVLKPSHGDYHCRHLYVSSGFATGIDFDNLALREPAFDVGYCFGQNLGVSWFSTGSFNRGLESGSIFLERYLAKSPIELPRLRLQIARSILQSIHYGIVMLNPHLAQMERIGPWLDLIEHYLALPKAEPTIPALLKKTLEAQWVNVEAVRKKVL